MLSASSTFCSEQHQHAAAVQVLLAEKRAAGIHIGGAVLQALRPALRPACCSSAARRRGALQRVRGRQATAPKTFEKKVGWRLSFAQNKQAVAPDQLMEASRDRDSPPVLGSRTPDVISNGSGWSVGQLVHTKEGLRYPRQEQGRTTRSM